VKHGEQPSLNPVVDALLALKPLGALQIQGTTDSVDRVFVIPQSTLVLSFAQSDRARVEAALEPARRTLAVAGSPDWQRSQSSSTFGPVDLLSVTAAGTNVIVISRGTSLADVTGNARHVTSALTYAAGYNHALASAPYSKLFGVLDAPRQNVPAENPGTGPLFFSSNVRSVADSLPRLQGIQIQGLETGNTLTEEVVYQLK
jgi:hypothetical protein